MNGSTHLVANVVDIQLKRGPSGLGFNIVGGVDQQYVVNDNGIYVCKIKENGAAALDGRLEEGDKILAINGNKLENCNHGVAVDLFRSAGEDILLQVQKKHPPHRNGPSSPDAGGDSALPALGVLVGVLGAAALMALLYLRFQPTLRRPF
ncbi:unnamed protein product [Boreogadus saida]|uniref:Synaptojanin 2 binding protein n=1 Tax=Gadus morhua TaxID=8049 RepID=A0A8C4YUC8_GADMO|nr:synaptojanin-2-binding protein [Gadus morhua]XP_056446896.1 synaptojanin-2-binding protein [Gadus chalcogrammus]